MHTILKPARLRSGDTVGIVSPASPVINPDRLARGIRYLERIGYRIQLGRTVGTSLGYLAGSDEDRAADLHAMFQDKRIKAIFCARGGYGSPRLLRLLDYRVIAKNPKILVGYSDITALHLALWKHCRLITFHGPMVGVEMAESIDPFTEEMFWAMLTSSKRRGELSLPHVTPHNVRQGVEGRLLGGNLSVLVSLLGTPFFPSFNNAILFLEDVGEEPYRIDRMLTQLRNAGILHRAAALLTGHFTGCVPVDATRPSFSTDEVLSTTADSIQRPSLLNAPFGHTARTMTLPSGIRVRLHGSRGVIDFREAAVK